MNKGQRITSHIGGIPVTYEATGEKNPAGHDVMIMISMGHEAQQVLTEAMPHRRWNKKAGGFQENPKIDAFLTEVLEVCKKHNLSISHEDGHGAFQVVPFNQDDADWVFAAFDLVDA